MSEIDEPVFQDKLLQCKICGHEYTWTAGEQLYFYDRNLQQPLRCPRCRALRHKGLAEDTRGVSDEQ